MTDAAATRPTDLVVAQAAASAAPPAARPTVLEAPPSGERVSIPVAAGQPVALPDQVFDPGTSRYVIDGDDLVVMPDGGGVVVFDRFFGHPENPPTLSVLGGPPVSANELLARAELTGPPPEPVVVAQIPVPDDTDTGAGPGGGKRTAGGGAGFAPYDPGDLGPGLAPVGPLGPTALVYGAEFPQLDNAFGEDRGGDREQAAGPPPAPPVPEGPTPPVTPEPPVIPVLPEPPVAPTIAVGGARLGAVAEASLGFPFDSTADEPRLLEKTPLAPSQVNGIDAGNVTLDAARDVSVTFQSEVARSKSALGVFQVGADGTFGDAALVFPNVNSTEGNKDGLGPLTPNVSSFSLGEVPAGAQLGFFLVADGANLNGWTALADGSSFPAGTFEIVRDGDSVTLLQNGTPVEGALFVTVDPDLSDPSVNVLNPDGLTHVASWYDSASGDLVFGFEDLPLTGAGRGDGDFNDNVFRLHFGPVGEQQLFYGGAVGDGALDITISDDGDRLGRAELALTDAQPGDRLVATRGLDGNGDGLVDGTAIRIVEATDTRFVLDGDGTIDQYHHALRSLRLDNDTAPTAGDRIASLVVEDADGNRSDPAAITVSIRELVAGGPGGDTLVGGDGVDGLAGRGGNDVLRGGGGPDFLDGGDGNDQLFGDAGNDLLLGGPGQDTLTGGLGGDRFIVTALGDGRDTILDFDAGQGDRLDLEQLFARSGFDPGAANAGDFLRFVGLNADGDGVADVGVVADLDGGGPAQVGAQVATLTNPVGIAPGTPIADVTTFTASDGATA